MVEEKYILSQEEGNKRHILSMLENKEVYIKTLSFDALSNAISSAKNILNEELASCLDFKDVESSNLYEQLILAKSEKIDKMIDLYNISSTLNSFKFKDGKIVFDSLKKVKTVKLYLEGFNYDYPINFVLKITKSNGTIVEEVIVPFDYKGVYTEIIKIKENENFSLTKPSNRDNILFYNCILTNETFQIGNLLNYKLREHYSFNKEGYIEIDSKRVPEKVVLLRYQPNSSFFELNINDIVSEIGIFPINDDLNIFKKIEARVEVKY
ncbi:MAG: hypothetical protein ACRC5T_10995 [Cetobacterium sp.]